MVVEDGLGPLEMRVLGLLDPDAPASVQQIQDRLAKSGSDLAYTTVMTVLGRLHEKGVVTRTRDGRRYLYCAAKRAPAMTKRIVARIQRALFPGDRAQPILALLDDDDLSADDLRALRRRIDERLQKKKETKA